MPSLTSTSMCAALSGLALLACSASFAEDRLGTLEPGRFADFIFIDRDIFANLDQRAVRETRVLETYVGGRQVWSRETATAG